ncbi:MAG: hypothetical protein ACYSTY_00455 [Planctomycetota bacterium]
MSAAETGLVFAQRRLAVEGSRFVVEKGDVDITFGDDLWLGTYNEADVGPVIVMDPDGYTEAATPLGVVEALFNAHLADSHDITPEAGDALLPEIDEYGTLRVRPIALTVNGSGLPDPKGPYFRLKYEFAILDDTVPVVLVTSEGIDGDITRTLQMAFRIEKKIEFAILSPNRIMIGKNVRVEGPLGSRFGVNPDGTPNPDELSGSNSHPLIMRSDFYALDAVLDTKLDLFFTQMEAFDSDGDGRLRPDHPDEAAGLVGYPELVDYDMPPDGYVDDYDLFMAHFDDGDRQLCYDPVLAAEVGMALGLEFDADDQLARLFDVFNPDRDGNGVIDFSDRLLGYRDGVIDANDVYAKVHGRLFFGVARAAWEAAIDDPTYQAVVHGPVRTGLEEAPVTFEASPEDLRELTTDMFSDSATWFEAQVPGVDDVGNFDGQVASAVSGVTGFGAPGPPTETPPSDATWEDVPFGSEGRYDYYQRPIYTNYQFSNVRIPKGLNALFDNCTFVGVTFIGTNTDCSHENWNYAGAVTPFTDPVTGDVTYEPRFPGLTAQLSDSTPVPDTRDESNNIRFHNCTFLGSVAAPKPDEYTHWRNKLQMTGTTRFYIDPDDPDLALQPDAGEIQAILDAMNPNDLAELAKSSLLVPGWSTDVGNFNNEVAADPADTPKVKLKGTIVSGILDVRGTADIHGTMLMTFRPVVGEGPLFYGGLPDAFNTTIGYFGPSDGDGEGVDPDDASFTGFGEITLRYDPDAKLPDGIPWPVRIEAEPTSYFEGGSL